MKRLLIVDMQKGFINKNNEFLVKNVQNLINSGDFDEITATKFINYENSPYEKFLNWTDMQGGEDTNFAVSLPDTAHVIEKATYGLPIEKLKEIAKTCGDEIYLCGTDFDACVLAIGYQLFDLGILPVFVSNAIGSSSSTDRRKTIEEIIIRNFGKNSLI